MTFFICYLFCSVLGKTTIAKAGKGCSKGAGDMQQEVNTSKKVKAAHDNISKAKIHLTDWHLVIETYPLSFGVVKV